MATFHATLMHGKRSSEGAYAFDGPDDLMQRTPVKVMRQFMEYLDEHANLGHIEYAINAAMKSRSADVVTILGEFEFDGGDVQPFICMIADA